MVGVSDLLYIRVLTMYPSPYFRIYVNPVSSAQQCSNRSLAPARYAQLEWETHT